MQTYAPAGLPKPRHSISRSLAGNGQCENRACALNCTLQKDDWPPNTVLGGRRSGNAEASKRDVNRERLGCRPHAPTAGNWCPAVSLRIGTWPCNHRLAASRLFAATDGSHEQNVKWPHSSTRVVISFAKQTLHFLDLPHLNPHVFMPNFNRVERARCVFCITVSSSPFGFQRPLWSTSTAASCTFCQPWKRPRWLSVPTAFGNA